MKIQGLNKDDFGQIDIAFRRFLREEANFIGESCNSDSIEEIGGRFKTFEDTLKTYRKITYEMQRYEEE